MTTVPRNGFVLADAFRGHPRRTDLAAACATVVFAMVLISAAPDDPPLGWRQQIGGLVAFGLVLARRYQTPWLLLATLTLTFATSVVWEQPSPLVFATLVLLFTFCVDHDRRMSLVVGLATGVVLYVSIVLGTGASGGDPRALITVPWTIAAVGMADATRSRRALLASTEQRVQAAYSTAAEAALRHRAEERLSIARELHDVLAHHLSVMNVQTAAAAHLLRTDPDKAEVSLALARTAGRGVLDELRELLELLRSDTDAEAEAEADPADAVAGAGLPTSALPTYADVPHLVDTMRRSGLDLEWVHRGPAPLLTPTVDLAAYRIIQESLTNAAKHGRGAAVLTTLVAEDSTLRVTVANPSVSSTGNGNGLGLIGMSERANAAGGVFRTHADAETFTVDAELPIIGTSPAPDEEPT